MCNIHDKFDSCHFIIYAIIDTNEVAANTLPYLYIRGDMEGAWSTSYSLQLGA